MFKLRSLKASRLVSAFVLLGALPGAVVGCGAPAKPAATVPPTVVTAAPVAKEEAPDLAPVAAPAELFALARFKKPKTALETVSSWASFPYKLHDVLPAELKDLESVVAWDAPLEAAMALDPLGEGKVPQPLAVVSLGLTSLDGALSFARAKGQPVRRLRPGVYRIGESDDWSCAAGVALGSAPARLVCGDRAHDVDGLFNYATRGLPNEPLADLDFQIELRLAPVKKKYEAELGSARLFAGFLLREVQLDNPHFDRALSDVAYSLVDETTAFISDLDTVRLDANLDNAKNVANLRFDLKFTGQRSWLVQASTETLSMIEPPPDLFWQLPADSTAASFGVGWKPGRLKPLGHTLAELLDAFLETEKIPAGLRDQSSKAVEALFDQNTKQVRAQGELTDMPSDPLLAADYRAFGWQMAGFDGDPKRLVSLFDGLTGLLGSRDTARILKDRAGIDAAALPKFSSHAVTVKGFKPGAKAYRVDMPKEVFAKVAKNLSGVEAPMLKSKTAPKNVPVSLIVAYDGARSWVGISPDEKALIKRLEGLKDQKQAVLRTRDGLEGLKGTPRTAAGFVTLERFAGQLSAFGAHDADANKLISALPHHGATPILFAYDLSATGPEITTGFTVPRAAVEDLGALVPVIALMAGKHSALATP
ncbi:MAG TPA: hypothetical protein VGL19_04170 [Polyangiaceae bacterium]